MALRPVSILVGTAVTVLVLDIVSKIVVVATLSDRAPVRLLGGFLHLLVARNPGAAFSFGTSMTVVFSAIAIGVIVVILRTSRRIRSTAWAITLGLLLGGATGNLVDRIFRYPGLFRGYVVDWIQIPHWPVFNLADSSIVCGGVLAVLLSARGIGLDGRRVDAVTAAPDPSAPPPVNPPDIYKEGVAGRPSEPAGADGASDESARPASSVPPAAPGGPASPGPASPGDAGGGG